MRQTKGKPELCSCCRSSRGAQQQRFGGLISSLYDMCTAWLAIAFFILLTFGCGHRQAWIEKSLNFDVNETVSVFEVTIR